MTTNPKDQAFPLVRKKIVDGRLRDVWTPGLTKREEFAKAAMQGMHAGGRIHTHMIPELAVKEADDLIAALNKPAGMTNEVVPPPPLPVSASSSLGDDIPF